MCVYILFPRTYPERYQVFPDMLKRFFEYGSVSEQNADPHQNFLCLRIETL